MQRGSCRTRRACRAAQESPSTAHLGLSSAGDHGQKLPARGRVLEPQAARSTFEQIDCVSWLINCVSWPAAHQIGQLSVASRMPKPGVEFLIHSAGSNSMQCPNRNKFVRSTSTRCETLIIISKFKVPATRPSAAASGLTEGG